MPVRPERTGSRNSDLLFSRQHRKCDSAFLMCDFDADEYTYVNGVAVPMAIIDAKEIPNSIDSGDVEGFMQRKITRPCGMRAQSSLECYDTSARLQNIPFCVYFLRGSDDLAIAVSFNDMCDDRLRNIGDVGDIMGSLQITMNGEPRSLAIALMNFSDLNDFLGILRNSS